MIKKNRPKFKNLDEEMDYYANIDLHVPMRAATTDERAQILKKLGVRTRKTTLTHKAKKAS